MSTAKSDCSYSFQFNEMARPARLELATPCLEAVRTTLPNLARGVAIVIERNQQVVTNFRKLLSPSFVALCFTIAAIFRNLRYIFVTVATINLTL